jgi:hypothetical protein
MKPGTKRWLIVIAVLLFVVTTYEIVAIYQTPRYRLAEVKIMLAGKLSSSPTPPRQADPSSLASIALIIAVYSPSLGLLLFAILFRRRKYVGPPTI